MSNPNTSRSSFDQAGFDKFLNASSDSLSNPSSPRKKPRKKRQAKQHENLWDSVSDSSSSEMALIGTGKSFLKKSSTPARPSAAAPVASSRGNGNLDDTLQQPGLGSITQPDSGELRLQLDHSSQEITSASDDHHLQQPQQQLRGTGLSQQVISELDSHGEEAEESIEEEAHNQRHDDDDEVIGISDQHKPSMLSKVSLLDSCESTSQLRSVSHNGDTIQSQTDMSAVRDAFRRKLDTLTESSDSPQHQLPSNTTGLSGLNNATLNSLQQQQQQQQQHSVIGTQSFGLRPLQPPEQKEMSIDDLLAENNAVLTDRNDHDFIQEDEEEDEDEGVEQEREKDVSDVNAHKSSHVDEPDGRLSLRDLQVQQQVRQLLSPAENPQRQQQQEQHDYNLDSMKPRPKQRAFDETRVVMNPRFSEQHQQQRPKQQKFVHVKSSGYGRVSKPPAAAASAAQKPRRQSAAASLGTRAAPSQRSSSSRPATAGQQQQQQPQQSSFNFDAVERQRMREEAHDLREQVKAERNRSQKLESDLHLQQVMAHKEAEQQRQQHNQELLSLKQENSLLEAKLEAAESKISATVTPQWKALRERPPGAGVSRDELDKISSQMAEQEQLMAGYQRENERLYDELKTVRASNKALVDTLTSQKLSLELELQEIRGQLQQREVQLHSQAGNRQRMQGGGEGAISNAVALVGDAGRSVQLEAELRAAKRRCEQLQAEVNSGERDRCELEKQIDKLVREKLDIEEKLLMARSVKGVEIDKMKDTYETELDKMQRKLKWFVENQRLVDKDQAKLKEREQQIAELQDRLQAALRGTASSTTSAAAAAAIAGDARVRDLERQVKELETILRKRDEPGVFSATVREHLEARIRELEQQLQSRESSEARSLRSLRQRYEAAKEEYEARIKVLEADLKRFKEAKDRPHSSLTSLQRELDALRVRFKEKMLEKDREMEKVRSEMSAEVLQTQNEKRALARVEALQREIRERHLEVDRLRREREKERQSERQSTKQAQHQANSVQKLQRENDAMKQQLVVLESSANAARNELAATRNAAIEERRKLDQQLTEMQDFHRREVDRLVSEHAKTFADSRVAQLQAKQETQEMMIEHLKKQLAASNGDSQETERLRRREQQLQAEVKELRSALEDERGAHTPQMRQFVSLRDQIRQLELRYEQRERELDKVLHDAKAAARQDAMAEAAKWKQLVDTKTKQIDQFRSELDLILEVLRQLQRQGVSLPVPPGLRSTLASL